MFTKIKLNINGIQHNWNAQFITGSEIKKIGGLPSTENIYLSLKDPWNDILVKDTDSIDLARVGIEYFFTKKALKFTINKEKFIWYRETISGKKIRELGDIHHEHEIFLDIPDPYNDEPIYDDTIVNLAIAGIEHFISKEKCISFTIIVNGRPNQWHKRTITYQELIVLALNAYDNQNTYSVSYKKGPKSNQEGTMVDNDIVNLKNNMIFNVTATHQS